jgi:hypothetical protein
MEGGSFGDREMADGGSPVLKAELGPVDPSQRDRLAAEAVKLFNAGQFWEAHEALEGIWRPLDDGPEALVLQGLIQAAAALLHRSRRNSHGVRVVGKAALEKLTGPQLPAVEFETVRFRAALAQALAGEGPAPTLELRTT